MSARGWRVKITDEWMRDGHTLHLYRRNANGQVEVASAVFTVTVCDENVQPPANSGLQLAAGMLDAITAELRPAPHSDGEVRRLEEALAVERKRVDDLLAIIHGGMS